MKFLDRPVTPEKDRTVVEKICKNPIWKIVKDLWPERYDEYQATCGNPWELEPSTFDQQIKDRQYNLYTSRRSGGPISRIRKQGGLLSCPVCGSGTTGDLDHYLPRTTYQEFSIMRSNLVPSCTHCNSGSKGTIVKGSVDPERFAHPYFDPWLDQPVWLIEFVTPLAAVTFNPVADPSLDAEQSTIMNFHLSNVLGEQFHNSIANLWSTLSLAIESEFDEISREILDEVIKRKHSASIHTHGVNGWETAFFRGLMRDSTALDFLHEQYLVNKDLE